MTPSNTLLDIERRAERALPRELRQMTQQILDMRAGLALDERAHADALLLKLDRLIEEQVVEHVSTEATRPATPALPPAPAPAAPASELAA